MGLPGAGKTTLAAQVIDELLTASIAVRWLNADAIRKQFNDWDFSESGRIRQSARMRQLADESSAEVILVDMVAPLVAMRDIFAADITVWVDTVAEGRFANTNAVFVPPGRFNFRITSQDSLMWSKIIAQHILDAL